MKFLERLKIQRKLKGLTQKVIADKIGVSKVAVSRWELGYSIPSGDILINLSDVLNCPAEWLLNGIEQNNSRFEEVVMVDYYEDVVAEGGNGYINKEENKIPQVPILKSIIDKQLNKESVCCIAVSGTSMEPVLFTGSVIALNPYKTKIHDGMMYVIRQNDLLRVKVLINTPNAIIVRSYNKEFSDEIYLKESEPDIAVIGQVFWFSSTLNI